MGKINKKIQKTIDKIVKIAENYGKIWNKEKVIEAMQEYYKELGVKMPEVVIVDDLVIGFIAARGAARGAAWDAARDAAWDAAWDAARDAAWDAAWGAARDAAWGAARGAAWGAARDAARGAARDAAWGAARDAAWGAARGAAATNTDLKDKATLKFIAIENKLLKALENGLGFYFPMKDKLILVPMPQLKINQQKRLHCENGAAVIWRTKEFYFLSGVRFEEKIYKDLIGKRMSAKDILSILNMENRMAAIKFMGNEWILKELNAQLIDKSNRGNELYLIKDFFRTNAYYLKYTCPSTGRIYISGVHPQFAKSPDNLKADTAMAWKFQLEKFEYDDLKIEA